MGLTCFRAPLPAQAAAPTQHHALLVVAQYSGGTKHGPDVLLAGYAWTRGAPRIKAHAVTCLYTQIATLPAVDVCCMLTC